MARETRDDYQRLLTRYAIERLLFRLSRTRAAEHYVLKGAILFATWPVHAVRPTGDLDLLGHGNPDPAALAALLTEICGIEVPEDGILFDLGSIAVEPVREADRYQGARLSVEGNLDGALIRVIIDVGFGDHVFPPPERSAFPTLLPGLPQAEILMYPPETVIAEKFEAMIRFGEANSRMKDWYDIWVITRTFPLLMGNVVEAILGTLRRRDQAVPPEMPIGLMDPFATLVGERGLWTGFVRRVPASLRPESFIDLQRDLRQFFGPVIAAMRLPESAAGRWDQAGGTWRLTTA